MNRQLANAPYKLNVGGAEYEICPSYRTVLHMINVAKNDEISDMDKPFILIKNLYKGLRKKKDNELRIIPQDDLIGFIEQMNWFIAGGKNEDEIKKKPDKRAIVCFEQDWDYIRQAYLKMSVNLYDKDLHWWVFKDHFAELPECFLTRLMYLRNKMRKPKGLDKEERKECAEIGWDIVNIKIGGVDMAGNIDIFNM